LIDRLVEPDHVFDIDVGFLAGVVDPLLDDTCAQGAKFGDDLLDGESGKQPGKRMDIGCGGIVLGVMALGLLGLLLARLRIAQVIGNGQQHRVRMIPEVFTIERRARRFQASREIFPVLKDGFDVLEDEV